MMLVKMSFFLKSAPNGTNSENSPKNSTTITQTLHFNKNSVDLARQREGLYPLSPNGRTMSSMAPLGTENIPRVAWYNSTPHHPMKMLGDGSANGWSNMVDPALSQKPSLLQRIFVFTKTSGLYVAKVGCKSKTKVLIGLFSAVRCNRK